MTTWMRHYPRCRHSGLGWISEVPVHWEVRRLRSLATLINLATPSTRLPRICDESIM